MDIDEFLEAESKLEEAEQADNQSIDEQLKKIRDYIKESKFDKAEEAYNALKQKFKDLIKKQEEERKRISNELSSINTELVNRLNKEKSTVDKQATAILDLIKKANEYVDKQDFSQANKLYVEIRGMYKQLPDAFAEKKIYIENQILAFYSRLVQEFNKHSSQNLTNKSDEIHKLVDDAMKEVQQGKRESARQKAQKAQDLYSKLPHGFLYEKSLLYDKILKLSQFVEIDSHKAHTAIQQPKIDGVIKKPEHHMSPIPRHKIEKKDKLAVDIPDIKEDKPQKGFFKKFFTKKKKEELPPIPKP